MLGVLMRWDKLTVGLALEDASGKSLIKGSPIKLSKSERIKQR